MNAPKIREHIDTLKGKLIEKVLQKELTLRDFCQIETLRLLIQEMKFYLKKVEGGDPGFIHKDFFEGDRIELHRGVLACYGSYLIKDSLAKLDIGLTLKLPGFEERLDLEGMPKDCKCYHPDKKMR